MHLWESEATNAWSSATIGTQAIRHMAMILAILRGWLYRLAYTTGGNFVRAARIRKGIRVKIAPTAFFKFPENITIGDDTFINHNCMVWASPDGPITIGRDVLFGPGVAMISSNHGIAPGKPMWKQPGNDAPIVIGNDVWLGAYVVVTAGCTIGDGCVVGAGAVVTRDLPAHTICAGVPARVLRSRGPADTFHE